METPQNTSENTSQNTSQNTPKNAPNTPPDTGTKKPDRRGKRTASLLAPAARDLNRPTLNTRPYTRFVSVMKVTLPTLAIILIGAAFLIPALEEEPDTISLEFHSVTASDQNLTMLNPRYLSSNNGNQQYMVTAKSATQQRDNSGKIELLQLQADITLANGHWLSVSAPKGWLDTGTETLDLIGGVEIFSDDGNQIYAKSARVNLKERRFMSPEGLTAHGPFGEITADSFVANQLVGTLRFEGNVKMTLYP